MMAANTPHMTGREFKTAVFDQFAQIAMAFASPPRIEIVDVLAQGERSVDTLARETGLSVANTSRHLQVLKGAHLVIARRETRRVLYRLADPGVVATYRSIQALAETRLADVNRLVHDYFGGAGGLDPVAREELLRRVRRRDVVVLDVRPPEEYAAGHIAGSLSIPLAELRRRLARLPATREVVAYCRGPYCVLAAEAVRLLRQHGRRATRLADGYPEWRDAGLPVEVGGPLPAIAHDSKEIR
jgi:rhodanese-related sulfurtransferase